MAQGLFPDIFRSCFQIAGGIKTEVLTSAEASGEDSSPRSYTVKATKSILSGLF